MSTKIKVIVSSSIGASIGGFWAYNRLGYAGENEHKFCPHEKPDVHKGFFYDTYYYEPNDCYLKVKGISIRPFKPIITKDNCFMSFELCCSNSVSEFI